MLFLFVLFSGFGCVGARQEQSQRELLGKELANTRVSLPQPLPAIFEGPREDGDPAKRMQDAIHKAPALLKAQA